MDSESKIKAMTDCPMGDPTFTYLIFISIGIILPFFIVVGYNLFVKKFKSKTSLSGSLEKNKITQQVDAVDR